MRGMIMVCYVFYTYHIHLHRKRASYHMTIFSSRSLEDATYSQHKQCWQTNPTGPSLEWIKKLYDYWLNTFSWSSAQDKISAWHHYTTSIENLTIHFVHEKARVRGDEAIPLLLVHGWPGTFYEWVVNSLYLLNHPLYLWLVNGSVWCWVYV